MPDVKTYEQMEQSFKDWILKLLAAMMISSGVARRIILNLLDYVADLAEKTSTELDDAMVAVLRKVVENEEIWNTIWKLIIDLINSNDDATAIRANPHVIAVVNEVSDDVKIDPFTIINLIIMIVEFIRKWLDRNYEEIPVV